MFLSQMIIIIHEDLDSRTSWESLEFLDIKTASKGRMGRF